MTREFATVGNLVYGKTVPILVTDVYGGVQTKSVVEKFSMDRELVRGP